MKTKAPAKGAREKRKREDDIPPPVTDTKRLAETQAFKQLEAAIKCEAHKGHCLVDRTGGRDNHRRLNFHEMTQWAQQIVSKNSFERACKLTEVQASGKATIYTPPHINGFDRVPAKKPRVSGGTPEVRVEVNFGSPRPGTEASYVVNGGMTHHIGQHPASGSGTANPETSKLYNIPVRLLLQLMDLDVTERRVNAYYTVMTNVSK